eukprot:TRINITY_DN1173_c3_g1_i2.p1 TRINITY_DN1173_c3_g1~~TRINITY_DN1173_c3_g1_i2.p1  ORF type:complete len:247 (+),score=43.26 TRINITY_DN1173_c3_g1_i2:74-742(+)
MDLGYNTSSSGREEAIIKRRKRKKTTKKKQLPLPTPELSKETNEHGRTRHVPHTTGLWSGHLYIDVTIPEEAALLSQAEGWTPSTGSPHLSLSKQLYLHEDEIAAVAKGVGSLNLPPVFDLSFSELDCLINEEKTTRFLVIKTTSPALVVLVEEIDRVLKKLSLPTFFKDPSFHVSIATSDFGSTPALPPSPKPFTVRVKSIMLVAGNKYHCFPLPDPEEDS